MMDELMSLSEKKEFRSYFWKLYSGVSDGSITMKDLVDLILAFYEKEREYYETDRDEWAYLTKEIVYDTCEEFAFVLLAKGLLDGRWSYSDHVLKCGEQTVDMKEIDPVCRTIADGIEMNHGHFHNWFSDLDRLEPKTETFHLALLDHCTEENVVAISYLITYLREFRIDSLEKLREDQLVRTDGLAGRELAEEVSRFTWDHFCHYLLEQAKPDEQIEAGDAYGRIEEAKTMIEAVLADAEYAFWMGSREIFPYDAYRLLTGEEKDRILPKKRTAGRPAGPETEEDARSMGPLAETGTHGWNMIVVTDPPERKTWSAEVEERLTKAIELLEKEIRDGKEENQ